MEPIQGHKDLLVTNTGIHFSFVDRLKVLIGWMPDVQVATSTEHEVGLTETVSGKVFLMPPSWMPKRKHPGYIHPTNEE